MVVGERCQNHSADGQASPIDEQPHRTEVRCDAATRLGLPARRISITLSSGIIFSLAAASDSRLPIRVENLLFLGNQKFANQVLNVVNMPQMPVASRRSQFPLLCTIEILRFRCKVIMYDHCSYAKSEHSNVRPAHNPESNRQWSFPCVPKPRIFKSLQRRESCCNQILPHPLCFVKFWKIFYYYTS